LGPAGFAFPVGSLFGSTRAAGITARLLNFITAVINARPMLTTFRKAVAVHRPAWRI
jgi:hypothetical protein